jgi:hypothetical protein
MKNNQSPDSGRVAIVEIAATDKSPAVIMVEASLNGETLTISEDRHNTTERVRQLAQELINEVRQAYGKRT